MAKNIEFDSNLTDNEKVIVYVIDYIDYDKKRLKMAIYTDSYDECMRQFRVCEGPSAKVLNVTRMTETEYKDKY